MTADLETRLTPTSLAGLKIGPVRDRPKTLNILIYGNPGVGKTVLLGSADAIPAMRPVLIIDVEGGTYSLNNTYPDVEVVRVKTWDELQELYNVLHAGDHPYRTIGLDSITEIQKFSMYQIMQDVVAKEPSRDPDIPSVREWGKSIEQIRKLVRAFRDLPLNVIFTALVKTEKDNKTGNTYTKPYLPGKLADEVAGFLDIVSHMYVKDWEEDGEKVRKRLLLTGATEYIVAKDRSGKLPLLLEEPTMSAIHEIAIAQRIKESV